MKEESKFTVHRIHTFNKINAEGFFGNRLAPSCCKSNYPRTRKWKNKDSMACCLKDCLIREIFFFPGDMECGSIFLDKIYINEKIDIHHFFCHTLCLFSLFR